MIQDFESDAVEFLECIRDLLIRMDHEWDTNGKDCTTAPSIIYWNRGTYMRVWRPYTKIIHLTSSLFYMTLNCTQQCKINVWCCT